MKLSARSRYATRLLLTLASHAKDIPATTATLSEATGVSFQFIEQIIRPLKKAGFIRSKRGAAGGHFLDMDPADITVGAIVRAMEGGITLTDCLKEDSECDRLAECRTRTVWERASLALERELDSITLTELLPDSGQLKNC